MRSRRSVSAHAGVDAILGQSHAIQVLRQRVRRVAPTEATVLILGERGTGKELVARAVHQGSARHRGPFRAVNCAALTAELLAAELFGHVRGAFTGAVERRPGLLVEAAGGTVFLDEIGDLPVAGQAMLLRVLQEREVRAVGASKTATVDVRIVAATNRDLPAAVAAGAFRADLLDRLHEVVIHVPPLREHAEDIRLLTAHFLAVHGQQHGRARLRIDEAVVARLESRSWPGNVRQLEKAVSAAVIFAQRGRIRVEDLDGDPAAEVTGPGARGLTARQQTILEVARRLGGIGRRDLTELLGLSGEAVRREMRILVGRGLLRRTGDRRWARYAVPGALDRGERGADGSDGALAT